MFGLFKKKKEDLFEGNYHCLRTDMHSHILPGIDDGSPDVETSVHLVKELMKLGYEKFIATPHIYPDLYPNTAATILNSATLLNQRLQEEGMDVQVKAAAEYFIDDMFLERVEKGEQFLTLHQNWILVEVSFIAPPQDLNHVLFALITNGYQPVLAHPERYSYYHHKRDTYARFKDQGCLLQVNLLSLLGYYGKSVQETARYLVKEGMVDLIGTDLHHQRHLEAMHMPALIKEVHSIVKDAQILNATL
jgi:protein-tyrosine phosphatase